MKNFFLVLLFILLLLNSFLIKILAVLSLLHLIFIPFLSKWYRILYNEYDHLRARLKSISYLTIFILYFLPVLLTSGVLYFWRDESWEILIKRLTPQLWDVLIPIGYSFFVCFVTFIACHDWAKNSVINKSLTIVYGKRTPHKTDHWFLRFCYWLHPETYVIGRLFCFHILYILIIYGSYYILLGFYIFKGVLF